MSRVKKNRKGYIVIYTVVILSLIISAFLLTFNIELMRKRYNDMAVEIQIVKDDFEKERAYLLSKASKYIRENLGNNILTEDEVHKIFIMLERIEFKDSFLEYRKNDKKIILHIFNEKGTKKIEYYTYMIKEEINKLVFIDTTP